jgi:hypothetical protein
MGGAAGATGPAGGVVAFGAFGAGLVTLSTAGATGPAGAPNVDALPFDTVSVASPGIVAVGATAGGGTQFTLLQAGNYFFSVLVPIVNDPAFPASAPVSLYAASVRDLLSSPIAGSAVSKQVAASAQAIALDQILMLVPFSNDTVGTVVQFLPGTGPFDDSTTFETLGNRQIFINFASA